MTENNKRAELCRFSFLVNVKVETVGKHMKPLRFNRLALLGIIAASACAGQVQSSEKHIHVFGEWMQDGHEHCRVCTSPNCTPRAVERGVHVGYPCEICGYAFKAVAFYTGINDDAHVSFCHEAIDFFSKQAKDLNFYFEAANDWSKMNDEFLEDVDLLLFLDTRPEKQSEREAFQRFMENGGSWLGFHFSAFAMDGSAYDNNWQWYHDEFLGSGQYADNTWAPTANMLRVETHDHFATENLPDTFLSAPNEWYSWEHDLRKNPDIDILVTIDQEKGFPVGNNPGEIWYEGFYPVVWSNKNYNMVYFNMGHNQVNYNTKETLSWTFGVEEQVTMVMDSIKGMMDLYIYA